MRLLGFVVIASLFSASAYAAGGPGVTFINYYDILLTKLGLDAAARADWGVTVGAIFSLIAITSVGLMYSKAVKRAGNPEVPESRFGIRTLVEMILDFVFDLGRDVIGRAQCEKYFPLLAGLFVFILFSNLSGLIPGFPPATESLNTNLAMGLTVFLIYNVAGIKEHGFGYLKHFFGPIWWLAPLLFVVELISHLARPISLSLRLYGNLFGDHLVLSVFTGLTYLIAPALLLFFGLLVACVQSFVFTLLSSIYISMAVSHDH